MFKQKTENRTYLVFFYYQQKKGELVFGKQEVNVNDILVDDIGLDHVHVGNIEKMLKEKNKFKNMGITGLHRVK